MKMETWQEYTKNDAVIGALNEIEDKAKFLTKEAATSFGLEWDEVRGQTVQQVLDGLLAKQLENEEKETKKSKKTTVKNS